MRNHLISCLEAGQFSLFPFDVNTRPKITHKKLGCTPHDGTKIIKCVNCELSSKLLIALAVNCCVIIHCLEVGCKEDQITSVQRE